MGMIDHDDDANSKSIMIMADACSLTVQLPIAGALVQSQLLSRIELSADFATYESERLQWPSKVHVHVAQTFPR